MNKNITLYRYHISLGNLTCKTYKILKETEKCYFCEEHTRFLKTEENQADIKDRTSYPYIDYFTTKEITREYVVKKIKTFLTQKWGLK